MNPISNLIGKSFEDLNEYELIQIINSYCDENKYFENMIESIDTFVTYKGDTKKAILKYFNSSVGSVAKLHQYLKYWTL